MKNTLFFIIFKSFIYIKALKNTKIERKNEKFCFLFFGFRKVFVCKYFCPLYLLFFCLFLLLLGAVINSVLVLTFILIYGNTYNKTLMHSHTYILSLNKNTKKIDREKETSRSNSNSKQQMVHYRKAQNKKHTKTHKHLISYVRI